jgi:hypothetical protein
MIAHAHSFAIGVRGDAKPATALACPRLAHGFGQKIHREFGITFSSNLPRLYLQRNRKGDRERAIAVSQIVVAACERAKKRKEADEWLRPTLLGAAFDAGDADKAEELATEVLAEGAARWKLATTMSDLESTVLLVRALRRGAGRVPCRSR